MLRLLRLFCLPRFNHDLPRFFGYAEYRFAQDGYSPGI